MMWWFIEIVQTSAILWLAYRAFASKRLPEISLEANVKSPMFSSYLERPSDQVAPRIVKRGANETR